MKNERELKRNNIWKNEYMLAANANSGPFHDRFDHQQCQKKKGCKKRFLPLTIEVQQFFEAKQCFAYGTI